MHVAVNSMIKALVAFSLLPAAAWASPGCSLNSAMQTVPLVELYTSEGCSSCPPADRWFSDHAGNSDSNWLAFHVDYWDAAGWRDRFGSGKFSKRQYARVQAVGEQAVYTPQIMVGDNVKAPWRVASDWGPVLNKARVAAPVSLILELQPAARGWQVLLTASRLTPAVSGNAQVWLAQYSDGQETVVRGGENKGVTLHHDHVVRHLWGPWALNTTALSKQVVMDTPSPQWGVTAFVQDAKGQVWQSLNLPFATCVSDHAS